jgi:cystathionine beta-lyase
MKKETLLAKIGTASEAHRGVVSIPAYRASTILFPNLAEFEAADSGQCSYPTYGRFGTPSTDALEKAMAEIEGAAYSIVTQSGLSAIATALLAFLGAGDHLLMVDSVYGSTRPFCDQELKRLGVEITYYDPCIGSGIADLIRPNTKVIFTESPGSLTFEMQDIPAICAAAHSSKVASGVVVIGDNTWGTPLYYRPFELGMDVSMHSATKYISGHSDLVMGVLSCNKEEHYKKILRTFRNLGMRPSGDECYLALRGLRTMAVRLQQHYISGLQVANWLAKRSEVSEVLHPALPSFAGHELWKRDFSGATSLFSIVLKDGYSHDALAAMLDGLKHFGMGYSWGGFESLIIPCHPEKVRTATKWQRDGFLIRLHIGLENVDDLIADLEAGFGRLASV